MKTIILAVVVALSLSACQAPVLSGPYRVEREYSVYDTFPSSVRYTSGMDWANRFEPDFVPLSIRVCTIPEASGNRRWEVVVTLQNQGGNLNLNVSEAPIDIYVDFDPDRPWGVDSETGNPLTLGAAAPNLLRDMPDQRYMSAPRAGNLGGASFTEWYVDQGSGAVTRRRIPTQFLVMLDQFRGNNPAGGTIDESDEGNNGIQVVIDKEGFDATPNYRCWFGNR